MRGAVGLLAILLSGAAVGMPAPAGRQVLRAERSDVSAPLTLLTAAARDEDEREEEGPRRVPHEVQMAPARDPVLQASVAPLLLPRTATSVDGIGAGFAGGNGGGLGVLEGAPADRHQLRRDRRRVRGCEREGLRCLGRTARSARRRRPRSLRADREWELRGVREGRTRAVGPGPDPHSVLRLWRGLRDAR